MLKRAHQPATPKSEAHLSTNTRRHTQMGTVYCTLGARLDVVEMLDGLMQGADRDLVKIWQKMNAPRFDNIMLKTKTKTKTVGAKATPAGIEVTFASAEEGGTAPARK